MERSIEQNAELAKQILDNPLFSEAFESLKEDFVKDWLASQVFDKEGREELFRYVRLIGTVKGKLILKVKELAFKHEQEQAKATQDEFDRV